MYINRELHYRVAVSGKGEPDRNGAITGRLTDGVTRSCVFMVGFELQQIMHLLDYELFVFVTETYNYRNVGSNRKTAYAQIYYFTNPTFIMWMLTAD